MFGAMRVAVIIAILTIFLTAGCGGGDSDNSSSLTTTEVERSVRNVADAEVSATKACFTRLGLAAPRGLRQRARDPAFSINLPSDLPGNRHLARQRDDRLRDCLQSRGVTVCAPLSRRGNSGIGCTGEVRIGERKR